MTPVPAYVDVDGVLVMVNPPAGMVVGVVTLEVAVTAAPVGGVPETVAEFVTEPAVMSLPVTV